MRRSVPLTHQSGNSEYVFYVMITSSEYNEKLSASRISWKLLKNLTCVPRLLWASSAVDNAGLSLVHCLSPGILLLFLVW